MFRRKNFLFEYLFSGCGVQDENIWIGLKNKVWLTGGQISIDQITDQLIGITAELNGKNHHNSCGLINTSENILEDENCGYTYKFLCEKLIG